MDSVNRYLTSVFSNGPVMAADAFAYRNKYPNCLLSLIALCHGISSIPILFRNDFLFVHGFERLGKKVCTLEF